MINTIIVDDEKSMGQGLKRLLESRHTDIKVDAVCYNLKETEEALNQFHPDLVFLDIELGKGETSFDLLNAISPINFRVIFTTAYNQYAISAIKFSAIDYLLKPIDELELNTAIEKFKSKREKADSTRVESLLSALTNPGNQQNKIHLSTKTGYELVTVADIIYCKAMGNQTQLTLINNKEVTITTSLAQFENLLTQYRFVRIHQFYLVNLNHVKKYLKGKDGTVITSNEANLTVSRNFKDKFIEKLRKI